MPSGCVARSLGGRLRAHPLAVVLVEHALGPGARAFVPGAFGRGSAEAGRVGVGFAALLRPRARLARLSQVDRRRAHCWPVSLFCLRRGHPAAVLSRTLGARAGLRRPPHPLTRNDMAVFRPCKPPGRPHMIATRLFHLAERIALARESLPGARRSALIRRLESARNGAYVHGFRCCQGPVGIMAAGTLEPPWGRQVRRQRRRAGVDADLACGGAVFLRQGYRL